MKFLIDYILFFLIPVRIVTGFVNKDGRITPSAVLQYVLDVDQPFDTVISCADGRLGAHRLVLASASPFIGSMFCSHNHVS